MVSNSLFKKLDSPVAHRIMKAFEACTHKRIENFLYRYFLIHVNWCNVYHSATNLDKIITKPVPLPQGNEGDWQEGHKGKNHEAEGVEQDPGDVQEDCENSLDVGGFQHDVKLFKDLVSVGLALLFARMRFVNIRWLIL